MEAAPWAMGSLCMCVYVMEAAPWAMGSNALVLLIADELRAAFSPTGDIQAE